MPKSVTNEQLRNLLTELGFVSSKGTEPKCLVFEHPESQARLMLPSNKCEENARSADVLSLRTHLLYRGHLDEALFDDFVEYGRLRAS